MDDKIKPIILDSKKVDIRKIKKLYKTTTIIDSYKLQLEDYFLIKNPKYKFIKDYKDDFEIFLKKFLKNKSLKESGKWIYFPWNKKVIHCLDEKLLFETRTARNVYLITKEEQIKFYKSKIGIAGLSVGSHIALTISMMGGAKYMKLADNDVISLSNLNRIRYPLESIGENKAIYCAKQIYEINPYADLKIYKEGITEKNIAEFLLKPKIDILIEEMDDLYLKIKIRELAKKYKIPVVMATDHDNNILIDIERFDLDPNYPILHGLLGNLTSKDFKNIPSKDLIKLTAKIAGAKFATPRMLKSLLEVGKTVYSWPQLGNAATLCGAVGAYLAKEIILKNKEIKSCRVLINIEKFFGIKYDRKEVKKLLKTISKNDK
jgi:molybdopterin/thiamine biosynthesis adenylyltransferase